jgi:inorganic pyrophosphatase
MVASDSAISTFIVLTGVISIIFALIQFWRVSKVQLGEKGHNVNTELLRPEQNKVLTIYDAIREGADSFLKAEYKVCMVFIVVFSIIIFVLTSRTNVDGKTGWKWDEGGLTAASFIVGSLTSMISGYIGMKVAVYSNARTTVSAMTTAPWTNAFNTAFCAGGVMGFALCGAALLSLFILCELVNIHFDYSTQGAKLFECVAGFGLGGSSIAMFGRVGGGIYTKAADVGADLAGKVVAGIPEDDPRNPATIADNVGDNVGDVAGMGADLFGSFGEASCAALVVIASSCHFTSEVPTSPTEGLPTWANLMFPLAISGLGILVCLVSSFIATNISPVRKEADVETVLKVQLLVTTILITALLYPLASWSLDSTFYVEVTKATADSIDSYVKGTPLIACVCVWAGLWAGCLIGFITEFYTSHSYTPTRAVAQSCETGAATNIIYGLALGYKSAIIPVGLLAIVVWVSFTLLDMFGVSLAALGMLSNLATCLSIDVYGPVCDNAGGIAEMAGLREEVREVTDALDAAGNTTAAIGKGFAIGSACLVGLALFGAFVKRSQLDTGKVSLLTPIVFAFLLIGAMIPYWFTAMTMKSVGQAANEMVKEVKRQFDTIPGLLTQEGVTPDHARCIDISTRASLREMIAPGILIIATPIITGIFFGRPAVAGLISGAIASSIQLAISASNTGGAWDNAKKYVEKGQVFVNGTVQGKGSEVHKAAVVGDTVGDPLKDTSGPALNIVMKLMAILALVFADFFNSINNGNGLIAWSQTTYHA